MFYKLILENLYKKLQYLLFILDVSYSWIILFIW